jgi:hypothetical protein
MVGVRWHIYKHTYISYRFVGPQILLYKQSDKKLVRKKQYTNRTYKSSTLNKTNIQMSILVSKYMYREQHDNRIIQYKAQQK